MLSFDGNFVPMQGVLEWNADSQKSGIKFCPRAFALDFMGEHEAIFITKILAFGFDAKTFITDVQINAILGCSR